MEKNKTFIPKRIFGRDITNIDRNESQPAKKITKNLKKKNENVREYFDNAK